ncbi:unnamed protein product, partial [Ectocarpus fasciculatus]
KISHGRPALSNAALSMVSSVGVAGASWRSADVTSVRAEQIGSVPTVCCLVGWYAYLRVCVCFERNSCSRPFLLPMGTWPSRGRRPAQPLAPISVRKQHVSMVVSHNFWPRLS